MPNDGRRLRFGTAPWSFGFFMSPGSTVGEPGRSLPLQHTTQINNTHMKTNLKRNINIATIIALFLIAMSTSRKVITQFIVFITLLTVVFGRDFLLKKQSILSRDEAVA